MRPRLAAALPLLLLLTAATPEQRIDEARRALARAEREAQATGQAAALAEAQAADARRRATEAGASAAATRIELRAAQARVKAARAQLAAIDRARALQVERLAAARAPLAGLLATVERMALRPQVLALADARSIEEIARTRAALAALTPAIEARTQGLKVELAKAERLRDEARQAAARLGEAERALRMRQAVLDREEGRARAEALAASDKADDVRLLLDALGDRLRARRALVGRLGLEQALNGRLATLPTPPLAPGPAATAAPAYLMPAAGTVAIGTGEATAEGSRTRGLTLRTTPDALVRAPAAGRIAYAGKFGGYGQIVIIDHGRGWTTLLAGLGQIEATAQGQAAQGQTIGRMGGAQPLLTIELRRGGRTIDVAAMAAWRGT